MQESGVEDRASLSSLAARRASEMLDLGARVDRRRADRGRAGPRPPGRSASRNRRDRNPRLRPRARAVPRVAGADATPARRARTLDPVEPATRVTTYDLHQHLWPEGFVAALRARDEPPALDGDVLTTSRGGSTIDPARAQPASGGSRALERDGIDVAVVSLQTSLGLERLPDEERAALEEEWAVGVARAPRRTRREGSGRSRRASSATASSGSRSGRASSQGSTRRLPFSTRRRARARSCSSIPTPAGRRSRRVRNGGTG